MRSQRKQNIAAGPPTGSPGKIFRFRSWALALAQLASFQLRCLLREDLRCHGFLTHLNFDGPKPLFPTGGPLLLTALPMTAGLLPPTPLATRAGPIPSATLPPTPARGLLPTGRAAVPLLGPCRMKRAFTPLQQTEPLAVMAKAVLSRPRCGGILRWAHGSDQLRGSSLGGELVLASEAFLLAHWG
jgi:hypothetical protein